MEQPYTKENIEAAMIHIRQLINEVKALESLFPDRHFTLDGHLVGSLGEVIAAYHYGIKLLPPSTKCHDGIVDGKNVQIKITQRKTILLGEEPDYLIVLHLSEAGIYEVYNGPGSIVWYVVGNPDLHGYRHLTISRLMKQDREVKPNERILALHPIEKLTM